MRQAFFIFLFMLVVQLIIKIIFDQVIYVMDWQHVSPSYVFPHYSLSEHFPWEGYLLGVKDGSKRSFPGDHAAVLMLSASFFFHFSSQYWQKILIWLVAIFLMIPRLIGGAHWASDNYIGGTVVALLAFSWVFYTPLGSKISKYFGRDNFTLIQIIE
ncbi:phosphatase PAP2 family protein [Neisseriaceae bacterium PsAf]|nr:phosphatase PAP2 family protein [Neisseriaceae bacterium PsAf]